MKQLTGLDRKEYPEDRFSESRPYAARAAEQTRRRSSVSRREKSVGRVDSAGRSRYRTDEWPTVVGNESGTAEVDPLSLTEGAEGLFLSFSEKQGDYKKLYS